MKKKKTIMRLALAAMFMAAGHATHAQNVAVSNNLVFDVAGALSAGVEVPLSHLASVEAYGSLRPWKRGSQSVHKHWLVQTQLRFWPCQLMNGWYWGPYVHGGEFNVGNSNLFFGLLKPLESHRYEGWLVGGGVGIGYEYALARHWNLGAEIGVGYTYIRYRKADCEVCAPRDGEESYHHFGPNRLGLSIIYVF